MSDMIHRSDDPVAGQMAIEKIRKGLVSCTTFATLGPRQFQLGGRRGGGES